MSYDKPKLRDFKHSAPYISIWYSIVFHVVLFVAALNLARTDFGHMADDFKKGMKSIVVGIFSNELSPGKSYINELFNANSKLNPDIYNNRIEKEES